MDRLLIVPAAGRGSRLGADQPKALVPLAGQTMLEHVIARHAPFSSHTAVVIAPSAAADFDRFLASRSAGAVSRLGGPIETVVQQSPTGMLDAILTAGAVVRRLRPRRICITWCDQVAISGATAAALASRAADPRAAPLILPTVRRPEPYIHFDRDERQRIVAVRQRREGDAMPEIGESDVGLFDLSLDAYLFELGRYAAELSPSATTGERNFLPFIPWLDRRHPVETLPVADAFESIGVNTPEEHAAMEQRLQRPS
jgi:bifunctional UDP-N-acetylglucosamine pyrophosphorylase/glucosamine-1-phosphate N-acetyltransferase